MSDKYAAALDGNAFDLDDLRGWFDSGPVTIAEIEVPLRGRVTAMLAREFDGLPSGEQVQAVAWRLIGQMNGILFATSADRQQVRVLGVYERTADGGWGHTAPPTPRGSLPVPQGRVLMRWP